MPVTTRHAEYEAHEALWKKCIDVASGSRAVKAANEAYLPRLSGQSNSTQGNKDYAAYLARASFYNGTGRTVDAMAGAVMRKPLATDGIPAGVEKQLVDVTLTDVSLEAMATTILRAVVNPGRFGVLVDLPATPTQTPRPYWIPYSATQVTNWREEVQDGDTVLVMVVLQEAYDEPKGSVGDDRFEVRRCVRYRVCELLTDAQAAGAEEPEREAGSPAPVRYCFQSVYEQERDAQGNVKDTYVLLRGPDKLLRRGAGIEFIPFVFFGPEGIDPCVAKPPCEDLVDVNMAHYLNSADYEWGLHWIGCPTPYVCGDSGASELTLGPSRAWSIPDAAAKVGFLEFQGQGLSQLLAAMVEKRNLMATLGGRLLETQKAQVEAAETVRLRQSGEGSVLAAIATAVSLGLTKLVQWHAFLAGSDLENGAAVALNKDFAALTLSSDTLKTLMLALQDGRVSFETWYQALEQAEIARPGVDAEAELKAIEEDRVRAQGTKADASLTPGTRVQIAAGAEQDPSHVGQTFTVASSSAGVYVLRAADGTAVSGYAAEDLVVVQASPQPQPAGAAA